MESCAISVHAYYSSMKAENLVDDFKENLEEWGLDAKRASYCITDMEAKLNAFGMMLEGAISDSLDNGNGIVEHTYIVLAIFSSLWLWLPIPPSLGVTAVSLTKMMMSIMR